jgi:hypothetical protein
LVEKNILKAFAFLEEEEEEEEEERMQSIQSISVSNLIAIVEKKN